MGWDHDLCPFLSGKAVEPKSSHQKIRCLEVTSDLTKKVQFCRGGIILMFSGVVTRFQAPKPTTPLSSLKNMPRPANSSEDCCQPQCRSHVWEPREWKKMEKKATCGIVGTFAGHGVYFDI